MKYHPVAYAKTAETQVLSVSSLGHWALFHFFIHTKVLNYAH